MARTYSTYEAKAHLSELLDQVRKGQVVTITHRGIPVAEVRPVEPKESLATRLEDLRRKGVVSAPAGAAVRRALARRKGALKRFLESRD